MARQEQGDSPCQLSYQCRKQWQIPYRLAQYDLSEIESGLDMFFTIKDNLTLFFLIYFALSCFFLLSLQKLLYARYKVRKK